MAHLVELDPGDTLIIRLPGPADRDAVNDLARILRELIPEARILIVSPDTEIEVAPSADDDGKVVQLRPDRDLGATPSGHR